MRIIIAGPPKAGNVWLKCLIGQIYGLRPLSNNETPQRPQFDLLKTWLEAGQLSGRDDFSPALRLQRGAGRSG